MRSLEKHCIYYWSLAALSLLDAAPEAAVYLDEG